MSIASIKNHVQNMFLTSVYQNIKKKKNWNNIIIPCTMNANTARNEVDYGGA